MTDKPNRTMADGEKGEGTTREERGGEAVRGNCRHEGVPRDEESVAKRREDKRQGGPTCGLSEATRKLETLPKLDRAGLMFVRAAVEGRGTEITFAFFDLVFPEYSVSLMSDEVRTTCCSNEFVSLLRLDDARGR